MQADPKTQALTTSKKVSRRFWLLLVGILIIAVTSSAIAVRYTATPILEKMQQQAIYAQTHKSARHVETNLERHRLLLTYISSAPSIVDFVLGYESKPDDIVNFLKELQKPAALSYVTIFDAFGNPVAKYDIRPEERGFISSSKVDALVNDWLLEKTTAERRVGFSALGDIVYFVLAEPIKNRGFIEGVVVSGFTLNVSEIIPQSNMVDNVRLLRSQSLSTASQAETVVALNDFDLSIALVPNLAAVAEAGVQLISRSTVSVALVLTVAFGIFAAVGRAALVEPHKRLEQQKHALKELAAIAEGAGEAIIVTDAMGRITWVNPAFEKLTGYSSNEITGMKPGSLLQGKETDPLVIENIREAISDKRTIKTEILNYARDGRPYWINISISPLFDEFGDANGFVAMSSDITEVKRQQDAMLAAKREIEHQALHDPLTSLPNRRALDIALEERACQANANATIVRIDLDHFKYVNDTMGHAAGDFLLSEVAKILHEETKEADLPVRTGGDEFVILLAAQDSSKEGERLAERMLLRIKQPKTFGNKTIRVGASFGVASTNDGLLSLDHLLVGADAALYEAKDLGRNTVRLYTPELHRTVLDRRELAREIRLAIANEEFEPYFQAQFDASDHRVVGAETLVRWNSPKFGVLSPNVFLPVASQLSAIDEIDELVLNKGVHQVVGLQDEGIIIPKLSFNVTADRIQNQKLFSALSEFSKFDLKISFEILESVLVEEQTDFFNHCLDRLREIGISIEIDDFGSGHASIVGLMHLRPDVMKIDQRLVMPITQSDTTRGLLKQIVGMAELMGLRVTAEGVETMEHARILADLGCHTLQGYAFCKPMPIHELRDFIRNREGQERSSNIG